MMKNSISNRLRNDFTLLTLMVVLVTDVFLILGIKEFYYKSIESQLVNRLEISMDYYYKNFADRSLESLVSDEVDLLFSEVPSEIQILDKDGIILMDNIGITDSNPITTSDIKDADTKNYGTWIGKNTSRNEFVIAVTSKIENSNNETIGYLRYISSLSSQNRVIINTAIAIFAFSAVVMIIAITAATYIADTIVKPIRELTTIASLYIDGQYKSRANINTGDEIESLADALNTLADEIVNKDKIKNDFISSISHELRTPLTSKKGWAVV